MYPVSDRFLAAIAEYHTPVTEVTLYRTDGIVEQLAHTGGSVTVDRGSSVRRTCSITLADTSLIPRDPTAKLSVYGARVRVTRGVVYTDGTRELVPLGTFRVDEISGDVDEGPVTLQGKSLEAVVSDDKFTAPYRATGTAVSAVTALIRRSLPDAPVDSSAATDAAIGARTWDVEADPWEAAVEVAAAIGCEVYADPDGVFVIAPLPDLLTASPAWTIAAGEGGAYIKADRTTSADGVYNGVLARGESTETATPPVSSLVVDNDPGSPTYWSGPFGRRPTFYSSSTLITVGACTQAATLLLQSARAPNATADISSLPNPALAPGDVLRVVYPDGTKELHQASSFTVPLDVSSDFTIRTISAKEGT
ncbi:DUF5047 domain-containing protein [Streptomyces filamentosus]|uniref:DUF5047 domain-containing protein n=1 Tax=Streptomyces filamentosus TaxID=67294 RepID=A0A919EMF3_STRFL|nr:DUF5047 domain-containing protein [Streptomyces filamentosus]GHG02597.1 hypothetical protein GCM10017667_38000 [Streptomyces filamentosus]